MVTVDSALRKWHKDDRAVRRELAKQRRAEIDRRRQDETQLAVQRIMNRAHSTASYTSTQQRQIAYYAHDTYVHHNHAATAQRRRLDCPDCLPDAVTTRQSDDVPESPDSPECVSDGPSSPECVSDSPGSPGSPGSPDGGDTSLYYVIVPIMLIMARDVFACIFM